MQGRKKWGGYCQENLSQIDKEEMCFTKNFCVTCMSLNLKKGNYFNTARQSIAFDADETKGELNWRTLTYA